MSEVMSADWDRLLWGVEFQSKATNGQLVGRPSNQNYSFPPSEPTRAWLFMTREEARAACDERNAFYATYPEGHACRSWRFRPVRVRETVRKVERKKR